MFEYIANDRGRHHDESYEPDPDAGRDQRSGERRHRRRHGKADALWTALGARFDRPDGPFGPGGPFGRGGPLGPGGPFGGGPRGRRKRGDVKFVLLGMLADGPKHGYELIGLIEERHGVRPSAGSIYPTLQLLEDGGFVTSESVDGKRVYTIVEAGRALLAERKDEPEPGAEESTDARHRLKEAAMKLGAAVMGARHADDATLEALRAILTDARKRVYAVLAEDES